jgi:hypothetical protein
MREHICAVCGEWFGVSSFPGGSTTYCSRSCGTRWGNALLPPIKVSASAAPTTPSVPDVPMPAKAAPPTKLRLAACGHLVPSHGGRPRKTCDACTVPIAPRRAASLIACAWCRREFRPKSKVARFCSLSCSSRRRPSTCSRPGCNKAHKARGLCSGHYNDERYPDQRRQFDRDPAAKRVRDRIRSSRRRAVARAVESERVDRDLVGNRDRWRCGICRRAIDRGLTWPDQASASLDHVVPLSEGGPHTYANTRIAHLACNVTRSNRGGDEQLALI